MIEQYLVEFSDLYFIKALSYIVSNSKVASAMRALLIIANITAKWEI